MKPYGSGVKTDINRDILAALVEELTPYRPVSNVAVDSVWSALRFRRRDKVKPRGGSSATLPDVRLTTRIKAPVERVWEAVATSEGLAAWFMPNDFRPEVGHRFHLDAGRWGMSPCRVTEVDPPRRLSLEWDKDWVVRRRHDPFRRGALGRARPDVEGLGGTSRDLAQADRGVAMAAPARKADVFHAIADPTRRRILTLLDGREMPVTLISGQFPISRTAVAKHLRVLSDAGLVRPTRVGRETRYRLHVEPPLEVKDWLSYWERY